MKLRYGEHYQEQLQEQPPHPQGNHQRQQDEISPPHSNQQQQNKTPQQNDNFREKWVKNLSKRELTVTERDVLSKGAGFAISPERIPYNDYIVAMEQACKSISSKGQVSDN